MTQLLQSTLPTIMTERSHSAAFQVQADCRISGRYSTTEQVNCQYVQLGYYSVSQERPPVFLNNNYDYNHFWCTTAEKPDIGKI